jgi:hypothetical protein
MEAVAPDASRLKDRDGRVSYVRDPRIWRRGRTSGRCCGQAQLGGDIAEAAPLGQHLVHADVAALT